MIQLRILPHYLNSKVNHGSRTDIYLQRGTDASKVLLKQTMQQLYNKINPYLKASCTHIKGNGSVKGTARWLMGQCKHFQFVARFDVNSYYQSMHHTVLLKNLAELKVTIFILCEN